jgi:hypothetical protein
MKYFLLLGGFTGFLLGFTASLLAGNQPANALLTGALGCVIGAILLRGLHVILMICLRSHVGTLAAERAQKQKAAHASEPAIQS